MRSYSPAELTALERADIPSRGIPVYQWLANRANTFFDACGVKGKDGRGANPSNILPATIRDGEEKWARNRRAI
jgi:hypothetical protein